MTACSRFVAAAILIGCNRDKQSEDSSDATGDPCGPAGWALLETEEREVLYVDANAESGGSGSRDEPLRSIADALEAVSGPDALIAVAAGTYLENLVLNDAVEGVKIQGTCRAEVIIDGSAGVEDELAVVLAQTDGEVGFSLEELTLTGGYRGLDVHGATVDGRGLVVKLNHRGGVAASGEGYNHPTGVTLQDVVISDNLPLTSGREAGLYGYGISIAYGATLVLDDSELRGNSYFSMGLSDPPISGTYTAKVLNTSIVDTQASPASPDVAHGLVGMYGAILEMSDSSILDSVYSGLFISDDGTSATLTNVEASNTTAPDGYEAGGGIVVQSGASLGMMGGSVTNNAGAGVHVHSATATFYDVTMETNADQGIRAVSDANISFSNGIVRNTTSVDGLTFSGIGLFGDGSQIAVNSSDITENACAGVWAQADSLVLASDVDVQSTQVGLMDSTSGFSLGAGVWITSGSVLTAKDLNISEAQGWGLVVTWGGDEAYLPAQASIENLNVTDTKAVLNSDTSYSAGLFVNNGATVSVFGGNIERNEGFATHIIGPETSVLLSGVSVRETLPDPNLSLDTAQYTGSADSSQYDDIGYGVWAMCDAEVVVEDADFESNILQSISVANAALTLKRVNVKDTLPSEPVGYSSAIYVSGSEQYPSDVRLEDVTINGGTLQGFAAGDQGLAFPDATFDENCASLGAEARTDAVPVTVMADGLSLESLHGDPDQVQRTTGIYLWGVEASLTDITISDVNGTGLITDDSTVVVNNLDISNLATLDSALGPGIGLHIGNSVVAIDNMSIAKSDGPGVVSTGSDVTCTTCTIVDTHVAGWLSVEDDLALSTLTVTGTEVGEIGGAGASLAIITEEGNQFLLSDAEIGAAPMGALYVIGPGSIQILDSKLNGTGDEISGTGPWGNAIVAVQGRPPVEGIPGPEAWDEATASGLLVSNTELTGPGGVGVFLSAASGTFEDCIFDGFEADVYQQVCSEELGAPVISGDDVPSETLCPAYDKSYLFPFIEFFQSIPTIED